MNMTGFKHNFCHELSTTHLKQEATQTWYFFQMVELALELMVNSAGELDPIYVKQDLSEEQHVSMLQRHVSSSMNANMTDALFGWAKQAGEPTERLLRLCSRSVQYQTTFSYLSIYLAA